MSENKEPKYSFIIEKGPNEIVGDKGHLKYIKNGHEEIDSLRISEYLARAEFKATDFEIHISGSGTQGKKVVTSKLSDSANLYTDWIYIGDSDPHKEVVASLKIHRCSKKIIDEQELFRINGLKYFGNTELENPLFEILKKKEMETNASLSVVNISEDKRFDWKDGKYLEVNLHLEDSLFHEIIRSIEHKTLNELLVTLQSEKIMWRSGYEEDLSKEDLFFMCSDTPENFGNYRIFCHGYIYGKKIL